MKEACNMNKRRSTKKKHVSFKLLFGVVVCFMIVGYATVSTVLDINGSATIGFNFDDVNIYIANLYANSINRYNSISEDKKSIELEIEPGVTNIDIYITNNASQYDEFASMECNVDDLNGVTISPDENNNSLIYSQNVSKFTYSINNTGEKQKLICNLENTESKTSSKTNAIKKIIFASDGYENPTAIKYIYNLTYGELPELTSDIYTFVGWFDINGNKILPTTSINNFTDEVLFARFETKNAKIFTYDNSKTGLQCDNIQCAITKLNEMADRRY